MHIRSIVVEGLRDLSGCRIEDLDTRTTFQGPNPQCSALADAMDAFPREGEAMAPPAAPAGDRAGDPVRAAVRAAAHAGPQTPHPTHKEGRQTGRSRNALS